MKRWTFRRLGQSLVCRVFVTVGPLLRLLGRSFSLVPIVFKQAVPSRLPNRLREFPKNCGPTVTRQAVANRDDRPEPDWIVQFHVRVGICEFYSTARTVFQ